MNIIFVSEIHKDIINIRQTHVSKGVQVIVGEFELLKRNELTAPVRSSGRGVRMDVQPAGHGGLCLSRDGPSGHAGDQETLTQ